MPYKKLASSNIQTLLEEYHCSKQCVQNQAFDIDHVKFTNRQSSRFILEVAKWVGHVTGQFFINNQCQIIIQ